MERTATRFDTRAFVTLMMAFSGLGLPVTGIASHIYGFAPLTTARHAWMAAHNSLALLFVVFAVWHIVSNRRALGRHLRHAGGYVPRVRREALLAAGAVGLVLLLFVGHAFHAGDRGASPLQSGPHPPIGHAG